MSELYIEGIKEVVVRNFHSKINEDMLYEIINETIKSMGDGFAELIDDMFRCSDYDISKQKQKEIKSDLYKWINDTNHSH